MGLLARLRRDLADFSLRLADFNAAHADWRGPANESRVLSFFGQDRPDASAAAPDLDWHVLLWEPDITQTIARMLDAGSPGYRGRNIRAFLVALGAEDEFVQGDLGACKVIAEHPYRKQSTGYTGRFDLYFRWNDSGREKIVVVEAKLDAKLISAQLSDYNLPDRKSGNVRTFVLGLDPSVMRNIGPIQSRLWPFCSWRDLILRYERSRPQGARPSDLMFLNTLWYRVGGLTQDANHARL